MIELEKYIGGLKWGQRVTTQYVSYPFCKLLINTDSILLSTSLIKNNFTLRFDDVVSIKKRSLLFIDSYTIEHVSPSIPRKLIFSIFPKICGDPEKALSMVIKIT